MNRVIPIRSLFAQAGDEQTVGVDHYLRVARLHRENEGVVIQVARDAGEFERAFHHPERRVAVAVHDAVGERTVVSADAHRDAALFRELDQRRETFANALELGGVLRVGVFEDLEFFRVGVVAGIDPHFLDPLRRFHRGLGFEMDVGDDRRLAAAFAQSAHDVLQIGRVFHRRRGDAHDLATDVSEFDRLRDGRFGIHRVASDHRLDTDRIRPTDADAADYHFARCATRVAEWIGAIVHRSYGAGVGCVSLGGRFGSAFSRPNQSPISKKLT